MKRAPQSQLVFDFQTGDKRKKRGQMLVSANAGDWKDLALDVIRDLAQHHAEFTADEVRQAAQALQLPEPHHPNAWGAAMSTAARRTYIVDTGRSRKSQQASANSRKLTIWRSCLYSPPNPTPIGDPRHDQKQS